MDRYLELIKEKPKLFKNEDGKKSIKVLTDINMIKKAEEETGLKIGIMYEDEYIMVLRDAVLFPEECLGSYIRVVSKNINDGVVVLPIYKDKIVLLKHFRHGKRKFYYEIPRGFCEDNLSIESNVLKELSEEIGLFPLSFEYMGKIAPDTGLFCSEPLVFISYMEEKHELFIKDKTESIVDIILMSPAQILKAISDGDIVDGFTLGACMLAFSKNKLFMK